MGVDWLRFREGKGERRKVARACCSVVALVARAVALGAVNGFTPS